MTKIKITSFDTDGIRSGRSLESVLSELGLDLESEDFTPEGDTNNSHSNTEQKEEQRILHICRLSFTTTEKARDMGKLIRYFKFCWTKILFEKASGRYVSLVLQDSVASTRVLEVKQHQRYDGIKWNFGLDWFPNKSNDNDGNSSCCSLEEIHLTGVRFRGGDELTFLASLSDGLEIGGGSSTNNPSIGNSSTSSKQPTPIGLKVLDLNACKFLHPDVQYPILFRGLKVASFGTLERLWMSKSPGLDDDRFEELFGTIFLPNEGNNNNCSLRELGFSFNGCGWKGSSAVTAFLEAPQSSRLEVLYLNRQQGELDLEGILRAAKEATSTSGDSEIQPRKLHLNLSQNYVQGMETLQGNDVSKTPGLHVELKSMIFEVPEAVIPGNSNPGAINSGNNNNSNSNRNGNGGKSTKQKSSEDPAKNLSQEEIAKLNVACGRVKYVLGRAAAASDRNSSATASKKQSNPSNNSNNDDEVTGSDWFFSSLAALTCVLPDLLVILKLQEKQNTQEPHENGATTTTATNGLHQHPRQQRKFRNWLPTFLRKAVKGKIEILKLWLLSVSLEPPPCDGGEQTVDGPDETFHHELSEGHGARGPPTIVVTESEKKKLKALWDETEALHTNIAFQAGQRRHKHAPISGETCDPYPNNSNSSRRKKKGRNKRISEIPMTPSGNPLVRAAYEAVPVIPTSVLECPGSSSPYLSLPTNDSNNDANSFQAPEPDGDSRDGIPTVRPVPPLFIDTAEGLSKLREDLFGRPSPHKLPSMIAVDSEWYFVQENGAASGDGAAPTNTGRKKAKNRSMSVATLQIAYVDENTKPMVLRSFVIDLLSDQPGFQELAKDHVSWLFGSISCDTMILGFAFGGDLRQLRKYAGISGHNQHGQRLSNSSDLAPLEVVESRCLDLQRLLASSEELRSGRVPGLKKCAQYYFEKPLKKDDQTSDWRERPLRPSQLEYAALDAVILLVLLSQKKQQDESSSSKAAATAATATATACTGNLEG